MKTVKIFDKVLDKVKPILKIDELNLNVYSPEYLPKSVSLLIYEFQNEAGFLYDLINQKSEEIEKLSSKELNKENLLTRNKLTKEIQEINDQINDQICVYIESVCKLNSGDLKNKINEYYEDNEELEIYPKEKLISDIYKEINKAIAEHREKETNIVEYDSAEKKS